jgi:hypothetical protein
VEDADDPLEGVGLAGDASVGGMGAVDGGFAVVVEELDAFDVVERADAEAGKISSAARRARPPRGTARRAYTNAPFKAAHREGQAASCRALVAEHWISLRKSLAWAATSAEWAIEGIPKRHADCSSREAWLHQYGC